MNTISVNYTLVYQLKFANQYQWTADGKCFNVQKGTQLKQCYNAGCIGYNIKGRFYSLKYLRTQLEKIPINILPF